MEQLYEFNIRDYWMIFLKRKWEIIISFLVVFSSIFIYTSLQVPVYQATALLKIDPALALPSEMVFPTRGYYDSRESELSDAVKQIVSGPIIESAAKELGWIKENSSAKEKELIISDIASRVSAAEIEKSNILKLSANFSDPEKAADIVNKMAGAFKRVNAAQKNERTHNVRVFIEQALNDVSIKLREQGERLQNLTSRGATGMADDLVRQILEAERKLTDYLTRYTERHPSVINLKAEIDRLKVELNKLPKEEFEYSILKRDVSINENLYTSLKTQLQEAQIKEAEKIDNVIIVNPAVVPRTPFYPNKAKNYLVGVILGLGLGITAVFISEHLDTSIGRVDDIESFIKVSVVGIIPYCKEQHREADEREKKDQRRFFKKRTRYTGEHIDVLEFEKNNSTSFFLEAFRLLGVNLQVIFGKGDKIKNKIIMLTSCKPEEGKTLITSTLGVIMAQMGYKVLIIDADVRRAHIHKNFGLKEKENGLTDILTGKLNVDSAIKTTTDIILGATSIEKIMDKPWLNNLNIITAGSTFPNVVNLFNSPKLNDILDYCRNRYDVVLIDNSPILAVSEPSILVPKTDGVLLVYRAGFTSRLALRRAKIQVNSIKEGALSGVILNNVTPEIGMDTYYYYNKKYYYSRDTGSTGAKDKPRKENV